MKLIDFRTTDGSCHFACLASTATRQALRDHIALLTGAEIVEDSANCREGDLLVFTFRGHRFSVSNSDGEFRFFVADPQCPDVLLYQVAVYCEVLLGNA